ncbi:hypothetical protein KFL_006640040 [Klebsormidium nitens]|uniref:PLAC8 family protein n=1 Tax=Klebsormidium nitens TaxID=105231 RepID=A0A1Y1IIJ9_KLENI|nr:hypothetical protein KFL_006640040 [Klebsormidium nitens]|eukprot:GAQ90624.1 hypothetical protein KFL_006640040 [Klebsormidium nitens]
MQADPESDLTPEQRGPSSTLDKLAAEKEETTGAPSHPLPIDDDEPPLQQTMSRADKNVAEAPAADEEGRRPMPKKSDHVAYVEKELKDWHTKWWEVWKDPVTTAYGCCLPCSLAGQNVNRVSDGAQGFWKPFIIECLLLGPVFGWCYTYKWRRQLREQNELKAAPFGDCLTAFLCHQCALCQEQREIKATESGAIQGPTKPTIDRGPSGKL